MSEISETINDEISEVYSLEEMLMSSPPEHDSMETAIAKSVVQMFGLGGYGRKRHTYRYRGNLYVVTSHFADGHALQSRIENLLRSAVELSDLEEDTEE